VTYFPLSSVYWISKISSVQLIRIGMSAMQNSNGEEKSPPPRNTSLRIEWVATALFSVFF